MGELPFRGEWACDLRLAQGASAPWSLGSCVMSRNYRSRVRINTNSWNRRAGNFCSRKRQDRRPLGAATPQVTPLESPRGRCYREGHPCLPCGPFRFPRFRPSKPALPEALGFRQKEGFLPSERARREGWGLCVPFRSDRHGQVPMTTRRAGDTIPPCIGPGRTDCRRSGRWLPAILE